MVDSVVFTGYTRRAKQRFLPNSSFQTTGTLGIISCRFDMRGFKTGKGEEVTSVKGEGFLIFSSCTYSIIFTYIHPMQRKDKEKKNPSNHKISLDGRKIYRQGQGHTGNAAKGNRSVWQKFNLHLSPHVHPHPTSIYVNAPPHLHLPFPSPPFAFISTCRRSGSKASTSRSSFPTSSTSSVTTGSKSMASSSFSSSMALDAE